MRLFPRLLRVIAVSTLLGSALIVLPSCQPERAAAKELIEAKGVEINGEALRISVTDGDAALARALLVLDAPVDEADSEGKTALMLAAAQPQGGLVSELLQKGADFARQDREGNTALSLALESGNLGAIRALAEAGADVSADFLGQRSLLAEAVHRDRIAAALMLVDTGASVNSSDEEGKTLLRLAVEAKSDLLFEALMRRDAKWSIRAKEGGGLFEPLTHTAVEYGQAKMLDGLLRDGMSVSDLNSAEETLAVAAASRNQEACLRVLKEHGADFTATNPQGLTLTHLALDHDNPDLLAIAVAGGASPDQADPNGWTPLHRAVKKGHRGLVAALLEAGANPNHKSPHVSPLALAIDEGRLTLAETLLKYEAHPTGELYRAAATGGGAGLATAEMLLNAGADVHEAVSDSGDYPIAMAVRKQEHEIVDLFLKAGAPATASDPCGQSLLHIAVAQEDYKMVQLLLTAGADPNEPFRSPITDEFRERIQSDGVIRWALRNSTGIRPIMMAADTGDIKLAQLLVAHGANSRKSTLVGKTRWWPMTFAARRKNTEMIQVMLGRKPGRTNLWIKVDLSEQRAYVYRADKVIYQTRVSSGKKGHRTPQGKYAITNKYREWESTIYESSMPYFQRLNGGDFGFHVGYVPRYAASHGCIRMPESAARKLFKMTQVGDYVEIVP